MTEISLSFVGSHYMNYNTLSSARGNYFHTVRRSF